MINPMVCGKTIAQWKRQLPLLEDLLAYREVFWLNTANTGMRSSSIDDLLTMQDILEASRRLARFAPYLALAFPDTAAERGKIESPLIEIPKMLNLLQGQCRTEIPGRMLLKCDNQLPISGSIKARGGIYAVLKHAEDLILSAGMLRLNDNYAELFSERFRQFFAGYTIAVGSTGNLGLSIGIMGNALGFKVIVHMSADAQAWKKNRLRGIGVQVVEHQADYSFAVAEGRRQAADDPRCYFIDDENSVDLFLGYATAALSIQSQIETLGVQVDTQHPLFVYLPCGVGGAPGGITFGLKQIYGDAVHCFFAEPTHAPCLLLGLATGCQAKVCIQDFGLDGQTCADGLAVGRMSHFAGKIIEPLLCGGYTICDDHLLNLLKNLADLEHLHLEPSALAGVAGPCIMLESMAGQEFMARFGTEVVAQTTHLAWATGGGMVPDEQFQKYYQSGNPSAASATTR